MPYITPDDLKPLLAVPQETIEWGTGVFPAQTIVEGLIADNQAIIDGFCAARYTVPFDPVPELIAKICKSLCLSDLLPQIHRGDKAQQQHDRAEREYKHAMKLLEQIQAGALSVEAGDDASEQTGGGPVIVSAAATPRMFSVEDES